MKVGKKEGKKVLRLFLCVNLGGRQVRFGGGGRILGVGSGERVTILQTVEAAKEY
jgi:hypothetical protein